jgi:Holliday junction resolvasome RuvABC DNA-binding subunit
MFYSSRPAPKPTKAKKTTTQPTQQPVKSSNKHSDIIEALEALGLENVTASQIDSAILKCFSEGTEEVSEDEILREVFRHMNRRNSEHKQRT